MGRRTNNYSPGGSLRTCTLTILWLAVFCSMLGIGVGGLTTITVDKFISAEFGTIIRLFICYLFLTSTTALITGIMGIYAVKKKAPSFLVPFISGLVIVIAVIALGMIFLSVLSAIAADLSKILNMILIPDLTNIIEKVEYLLSQFSKLKKLADVREKGTKEEMPLADDVEEKMNSLAPNRVGYPFENLVTFVRYRIGQLSVFVYWFAFLSFLSATTGSVFIMVLCNYYGVLVTEKAAKNDETTAPINL